MSCKGHNHGPACPCHFGIADSSRRHAASRKRSPSTTSTCPVCGMPVYFVAHAGGGTYFDSLGSPWPRHRCTDGRTQYSPFGRTGKPKLRHRMSELERAGCLPLAIGRIESVMGGTIVHGHVLDSPTVMHLGTSEKLDLDTTKPTYVRLTEKGWAALNYFSPNSHAPTELWMVENCYGPLDLLMAPPR